MEVFSVQYGGRKISHLSNKVVVHKVNSVFKNEDVKAELTKLYKDFVVVPIDKASSNVSFICKNHYADVIKRELKFSVNRENALGDTHENVTLTSTWKIWFIIGGGNEKTCLHVLEPETTQRSSQRKIYNRFPWM